MSTTLSMWLGIAFLFLAILAVLLQAWLWGPKFWNEEKKKTEAPRAWLRVHAFAGYAYGVIYVVMMWNMLPRLWEYQYELPARTVFHAVLAITIGVLLICKILILIFFRHFEEAMPRYGFALLLCTVVMTTLSVPYALRVHDFDGRTTDPENVERVRTLLSEVDLGEGVDVDTLVTPTAFDRGRRVLVGKCITCHDMRTVLVKPRTAKGWHKVNERMLEKPAVFGEALDEEDLPFVTAYLVAITPDIQKSAKSRREDSRALMARSDAVVEAMHDAEVDAAKVDEAEGEALLQKRCVECHELDDVTAHGGDDAAGWRSVIAAMIDEGAEISDEEITLLTNYLVFKYPPKPEPEVSAAEAAKAEAEENAAEDAEAAAEEKAAAEDAEAEGDKTEEVGEDGEAKPKPKPKARPKAKGDKKNGKKIFMAKCKACHGADGKGETMFGSKIGIVSLHRTRRSQSKIRSFTANGVPGTKMKPYEGKLSDTELDDVARFVKTLR